MTQKSKRIVARLLILIFAFYYADICFFYHSHTINGATIVHSHFHNKPHVQNGTHSDSEITLISVLSAFQSLPSVLCILGTGILFLLLTILLPETERRTDQHFCSCISLRAPPAFS